MRLKHIRESKHLPLRALSDKAGVSYVYLCNVENEKANVSLETLRRIAKALKVRVVDLVADE